MQTLATLQCLHDDRLPQSATYLRDHHGSRGRVTGRLPRFATHDTTWAREVKPSLARMRSMWPSTVGEAKLAEIAEKTPVTKAVRAGTEIRTTVERD